MNSAARSLFLSAGNCLNGCITTNIPFLISSKKGAATSVYLASSEEVRNITGKYFERCKAVVPKNESINLANQKLLWEKSTQFSGLNV